MATNPAAEGFPFERVRAAKRYLFAIKPWWARYGERLKIVPVFSPPRGEQKYGSFTSTDQGFRLYVDRTFATSAPLHQLAAALEHEFQHHTRDSWNRLRWLTEEEWSKWANIALDLEINGGIEAEAARLTMDGIRAACARSVVFSVEDLARWQVTSPPSLAGAGGWVPQELGMPVGLSAEEYLEILRRTEEPPPPPEPETPSEESDPEKEESSDDSDEGDSGSDEIAEPDGGEGETDSDSETGDDESDAGDEDDESAADESAEGGGESGDDEQSDSSEASDEGEQTGEEKSEEGTEGESDGDAGASGEGEAEGEGSAAGGKPGGAAEGGKEPVEMDPLDWEFEGDETGIEMPPPAGAEGTGVAGNAERAVPESATAPDGSPASQLTPDQLGEIREAIEEKLQDIEARTWAAELINPEDPISEQPWMPDERRNERAADAGAVERAFRELEEDVAEAMKAPPAAGLSPGTSLVNWRARRRRVRGLDWQSRLNRLVSSAINSERTSGASDLSYSVPNPNQPRFGAILQGMHDYAPKVLVIQDVSASMRMNDGMNRSMSSFTDLVSKVLGRFNTRVKWISVDAGIVDVGEASGWNPKIEQRWSRGFGGTQLGPIIEGVMRGTIVWKRKRIEVPDITIISSDCMFTWPKTRPTRRGKLLVISVAEPGRDERFLPPWLDRRREYVSIGD